MRERTSNFPCWAAGKFASLLRFWFRFIDVYSQVSGEQMAEDLWALQQVYCELSDRDRARACTQEVLLLEKKLHGRGSVQVVGDRSST